MVKYLVKKLYSLFLFLFCDIIVFKKKRSAGGKNLLIVRADAIGDYILFRNFLTVIRNSRKYSGFKITLCGNAVWRDIAEKLDGNTGGFIWIDRKKFQLNYRYRINILKQIRDLNFSEAINPVFSRDFFISDAIMRASCAAVRTGFDGDNVNISSPLKFISDGFYTRLIKPDSGVKFEFYRNAEFFDRLLEEKTGLTRPEIDASAIAPFNPGVSRYAVIFPGSSSMKKTWPAASFSSVALYLRDNYDAGIVLCGSKSDMPFADKIDREVGCCVNLCGRTSLTELISVLSKSLILLSNDTSAVHMAAALERPVVYIMNGALYGRFGPYPCEMKLPVKAVFPYGKPGNYKPGIKKVTVESVLKAIDLILQKE